MVKIRFWPFIPGLKHRGFPGFSSNSDGATSTGNEEPATSAVVNEPEPTATTKEPEAMATADEASALKGFGAAEVDAPADTIYVNGAIYTVNPAQPWADAVAIGQGVILAVGSEDELLEYTAANTEVVDLNGAMMLPGFQDPHLHVLETGLFESLCFVTDVAELDDYFFEIQDCAKQQNDSEWVRASGANMSNLLFQEVLPIELLDKAVPDRPVIVLDDIEAAAKANASVDRRHRLTHLYLIDPADIPRFSELGAIADFQYAPSSTDDEYIEFIAPFLGDRIDSLLSLYETYKSGATVVLSSDWDADTLSPFEKIQNVLVLDEGKVMTLDDVIRMMTLDVAYLLHHDQTTGSIESGKFADLLVIDRNLFEPPLEQIGQTKVLLTLLEGKEVYRGPGAP